MSVISSVDEQNKYPEYNPNFAVILKNGNFYWNKKITDPNDPNKEKEKK